MSALASGRMVWLAAPQVGASGAAHATSFLEAVERHVYADLPPISVEWEVQQVDDMPATATDVAHAAAHLQAHPADEAAWRNCIQLLRKDSAPELASVVLTAAQNTAAPLGPVLDAMAALVCHHSDAAFWQCAGPAPLRLLMHLLEHPARDTVGALLLCRGTAALLTALHAHSPAAYEQGLKTLMHDLLEKRQGSHEREEVRTMCLWVGAQVLEQRVAAAWDATLGHGSARACTQGDPSVSFVLDLYAARLVAAMVRHPRLVRLVGLALAHDAVKTANVCLALSHTTAHVAQLRKRVTDEADADEALYRAALSEHGTLQAPTTSPQLWTQVALLLGSDEARTAPPHLAAYLLRALSIVAPMYPAPTVDAHTPRAVTNEEAPALVAFRACVVRTVMGVRQALATMADSLPASPSFIAWAPRLRAVCLEAAPLLSVCAAPSLARGIESLCQALCDPSYSRFEMLHTLWLEERVAALDGTQRFIALFLLAAQHISWAWPLARAAVRLIDDVLHVLCDRTVGVLLPYIPWGTLEDGPRVLSLWTGLAECLAAVFAHVPRWSRTGDRQAMLPYLAPIPALASYMVQSAELACRATELEGLADGVLHALLLPLREAVAWLRLNQAELLQQLFDYLRRTLKVLTTHDVRIPFTLQASITDFVTQQLAIDNVHERRTLLTTPQMELLLEECRALPPEKSESPRIPAVPATRPLRQQTLPWAPARPAHRVQGPTPVVDLTREAPTRSSFRPATSSSAGRAPNAPRVRTSTGKLAQLRNEFQLTRVAARKPHAPRRAFEPDEPRAPLATSSVTGAVRALPPRPAPATAPAESDTTSGSESEDDEQRGLASLASPPRPQAAAVRRRVQPLVDPALHETVRRAEDEQRRRRLRTPPTMAALHEGIVHWDLEARAPTPPCCLDGLPFPSSIPHRGTDTAAYMAHFGALLSLEAYAQFQQSCEQRREAPSVDVQYVAQRRVDRCIQLELVTTSELPSGYNLSETDVLCLEHTSRAWEGVAVVCRAKSQAGAFALEVRCAHTALQVVLPYVSEPGWRIRKLLTLTTLRREHAALNSLPDLTLALDVLQARVAPRTAVSEAERDAAAQAYSLNAPQAQAVVAAMRTNGFSLIQGPPGTGKTKTIGALVASYLVRRRASARHSASDAKLLLCAPSNAAIDELVARLKNGVEAQGKRLVPRLVRLGREDAVHPSVQDVMLDALARGAESVRSIEAVRTEQRRMEAQVQTVQQQLATSATPTDAREQQRTLNDLSDRLLELREELQSLESRERRSLQRADPGFSAARQQVLDGAEVVCATLTGAGHELLYPYTFDTVIIDEAAQAVELSALIPLRYECRRCILVGDPKQLPPTVLSTEAERQGYAQSLFVRLYEAAPDRVHLLSIQYRMHPSISQFPSAAFYARHLRDGPGMAAATVQPWHTVPLLGPFRFLDVQGPESVARGHSLQNVAEAHAALQAYDVLRQHAGESLAGRVAFISMYKAQVDLLRSLYLQRYGRACINDAEFRSVDGFQGQEKDVVFLSCVRSNANGAIGFLSDHRRLNVALTRARSNMVVLGDAAHLSADSVWRRLIQEARETGCYVKVTSRTFVQGRGAIAPPAVAGVDTQGQGNERRSKENRLAKEDKREKKDAQPAEVRRSTPTPINRPTPSKHPISGAQPPPKRPAPPRVVPSASLLTRPAVPRPAAVPPEVARAQPTWLRSARPSTLSKKPRDSA